MVAGSGVPGQNIMVVGLVEEILTLWLTGSRKRGRDQGLALSC
jgi:hypothetical protein